MFGLLVPLLAPSAAVRGQTLTFDADPFTPGIQDGPGIWNSTLLNFWNGSAFVPWPNTTADIATFGGGTSGTAGYVQVGSGITANGMVFNAPNAGIYTLGGATITLGGTAPSITANSAAIIRSIIAGSSLDKNGSGTLTLFGANTYTGLTTINDGTLRITNVLGLGTNAAGTVVNSGGALDLSIVNATPTVATEALTLNGTGVGGAGALVVNNSATWSGGITVASVSTTNVLAGATLTASGGLALTGTGALTKTGLGTLALTTTSSTGTAGLIVNAGIVTSNNAVNWAGSSTINAGGTQQVTGTGTDAITNTQSITVNAGGALDWQQTGAETFTRLNLSGTGLFGTGALVNNAATAGGALTLSGGVVLGADTTMGAASGGSLNLGTAVISGTGFALTKVGAGTITTGGANTYSGATTVTAGTLTVSGTAGAIAASSAVTARGGLLSLDNTAGNVNRIGDAVTVTLAGGGELSLTGNGTTNTTETIGTLALGAGSSNVTLSSPTGRVTTLAASGASRAAGATALVRGTNLNQSVATPVSRITLTSTAGLAFVGTNTLNNGSTTDATQALRIVPYLFGDTSTTGTGSNFVTYDTTLGLRVLLTGQQTPLTPASTTAAAPINAIGFNGNVTATSLTLNSLLFSTTGQTLGGATSTALTINSGAIASNVAAATIAATAPLTLGNGTWNEGVITVAGAGSNTLTIASTIGVTGSGGLTKAGGGTLTLSNTANTYSGVTTINQGTVNFAGLGSLGSGGITLAGGGLQWGTSNTADISARTVTFSGPATLDVGANNVTLAGGVGAGGAGGLIKAGTGTLTLGAANSYSGGTTVSAGTLSFSAAEQLGTLGGTVANGITLAGGSLQAANSTGTADLSAALLNLTGAATIDVSNAGGTLRLGPMIGSGAFTKTGAGTLTLVGDPSLNSPFSGNKTFNGGTTNVNGSFGSSGTSVVTVAGAAGNAILNVQGGTFVQDSLLVGNVASGNGAVFQSAGTVQFTKAASTTTLSVGSATGGFGYYRLSGGSLTAAEVGMGGISSVTATGLVDVTGGMLNVGGWLNLARGAGGSTGVMTVSGGTVNLFGTAGSSPRLTLNQSAGNTSILTLSGGSIVGPNTTSYTLDFNSGGGNSTSVVNLNGGELQIYGLIRTTAGGANPLLLNFDGGTLRYAGNATTNTTNATFLANVLTAATIYGGGATIDDNGGTITIAQPLLAPTGNGITAIAAGTAGSGYISPPAVTISGGGGTGATAVATVDTTVGSATYGQLTGFTVTNRGTGYTSAPTITLAGGGGTAGAAGVATLAANAASGGLVKTGDGTLILSGANTFGGPITITTGTLNFGNTATQTLPGNVSGAGTLVQSGSGMTLLTGSRTTSGTGNLLATTATGAGAFSISGPVTSATPQTLANASTAGGVLTVAGPLTMGSNLLTISGAGTTRLTNTQSGGAANSLAGGIAVTGSTLVGYAPAAGGVGAGGASSLGSAGVTLSGTSPVLRIAPALGTSLAGGTSPGLFAKGYSGASSLAGNNFLGSSNAITTMTGGFSYLNVPAGGAIIPNVPVVGASSAFTANTSYQITGLLNVTTAGNYLFSSTTDDFGSLQVDGSSPVATGNNTATGSLFLSAGLHTISYRAGNNGSAGTIGLQYQGPDQPTLGSIPASAFFVANNAADLATTFTTPVTLAATTSGTIDIASDTTVSSVQMSGTGAGTVLNATGSGNISRLTINALSLTDSLTLGQTATNATALLSVGTIDNTSASPVTLTLGNSGSNLPNTNAITGGITQSGGGAVSVTQTGTSNWTLSGTNTYTGPTTISAGTLTFGSPAALYGNTPASWTPTNVTIASGAALGVGMGGAGQWTQAGLATLLSNLDTAFVAGSSLGVDVAGTNAATLSTNLANTNSGGNTLGLVKLGTGSLTLSGANTYTGNTAVTGGTLNVTGTLTGLAASSVLSYGISPGPAVVNVSNNMTLSSLFGGNAGAAVSVYNQTAGTVTLGLTADTNTNNAISVAGYGYLNLTGGTIVQPSTRFNVNAGSGTGVAYVGGNGTFNHAGGTYVLVGYNGNNAQGSLTIGPGGSFIHDGATQGIALNWTQTGTAATLNLAGGLLSTTTQSVRFGGGGASGNQIGALNLAGGTFSTGSNVTVTNTSGAGNAYYVNLAGGALRTTAALSSMFPSSYAFGTVAVTAFGPIDNGALSGAPSFSGGLVVDTNGFNSTLAASVAGAGGVGVTQANIAIPSAGNSGYVGAPFVRFSNPAGGGVPASGYALIANGQVTGIVITAPGTYAANEQPTVTLTGGGGSIAAFQTSPLATANTSGGITKTGSGTLTFTAANTFSGPISVNAGLVAIGNGGSLFASQFAASKTIGRSVTVATGGAIVGESAASLQQVNRVVSVAGGGVVAVTAATAGQDVNLGASGFNLPGMGLGASGGAVTYTGTYTPGTAGVFNLGGGGGTLLFGPAITGPASVNLSSGTVALTGSANTFTGGLTLGSTGTLQITAGNAAGGAFGNTRFGLVSQGGTIRWESGATTDITAGAGKIASTGSGGVSINYASGTTTLDTNGNTVTLAGAVGYGTGAIQKTTAGTLVLAGATNIANPFTGGTTISTGAIQLGNATALRTSTVTNSVANGLTFSSGVGAFTIGGLAGAANIALTDTAATAVQLRVGANNSTNTFTGVLSGSSGQFVKVGVGVQTFTTATQTYTGSTVITGGVSNTNLGNSGTGAHGTSGITLAPPGASTNLLSASSPLQFGSTTADLPGGGTFTMTGPNSAVTNAQTFASTTVVAGYSATSLTSGNASNAVNLTLNALSRTAVTRGATTADAAAGGGTINFTALANAAAANQIATTTTTANDATGILGAWAYAGGTDYAAVNGSSQIIAYTGYTTVAGVTGAGSTTQNALFNTGASINTATVDYNTVKLGSATANFFATGTNTLRLGAVGGLLLPSGGAAMNFGTAANNGILTAGGTTANNPGELIVFNGNAVTGNNLTLNSTITNNGTGAVTLVKTGSGQITLAGTNTFTGGTIVQQGRVQVNANVNAFGTGAVTILPGGQVFATGGTFANSFFIAGSGINETPNYGAIRLDTGGTVSGNVTLIGDAVIGTNGGTNVTGGTVSGAITGGFSLFKSAGEGRIILTGANTYTGATVAQRGVLQFGTGTASTQSFSSLAAQSVFVGGYPGGAATSGNTVFVNTSNAGDFQTFLATKANPASTGTFAFANSEAASNIDFAAAGLTNAWLMAGATTTYTGTFTPGSPGQFRFGGGDASGALTFQSTIGDYSPLARSSVTIGQTNTNTVGFTGSNTYSGGFSLSAGTYQLGSNLGQQFGSAAPGIAGVTMTGGTIQWRAATTVDLTGVTGGLTFTGGTFDTNGNAVTFASPINPGTGTLTRTGTGAFTLGSVAPIYGWTGNLTNSGGAGTILLNTATSVGPTAQLSIANVASNTIRLGTSLTAGAVTGGGTTGGVLDLNGNVLTTGFANAATTYTGQITSSSGTSTAALTKTGSGTFTWVPRTAAANYTGATTIRGGVLTLDIGNANAAVTTQPINVGSALVLGGGGLTLTGKASTTNSQAFASTTLSAGGANSVNVSGNNATANPLSVDLKALTRNVGATIDFVNPANGTLSTTNGITTSTLNGNFTAAGGSQSILGGYATVAGTSWAVTANSGANNFVTALATSNAGFAAGTNVDAPIGASAPGPLAVNSLRFNTAGAATVDATGGLTVASGGILVTSTVGTANGVTFNNGTLATGNGTDLVIINNNGTAAAGAVTVNSQITGGSGVALTKSGGGYLVLGNAANDYGATYLNAGVLQVSAPGNLGSGPIVISNNAAGATTRLEFTAGGTTFSNNVVVNGTQPGSGLGLLQYAGPAGQFVTLSGAVSFNQQFASGGHIGSATSTGGFVFNGPINAPYGVTVQLRNGTNTLAGGGTYYALSFSQDTLRIGANDGIAAAAVLNVATSGAGTVDLNGFNQTLEGLTQTASFAATVTNTALTPATLTFNPVAAWETYTYGSQATAGTITGNVNIVKTGQGTQTLAGPISTSGGVTVSAGTLVLSGANTFTGGVTVGGGTLRLANPLAMGLLTGTAGNLAVNGGTLDVNGIATLAVGAFSGSGGVITDLSYGSGTSTLSVASNADASFAGSINDGTGNAFNRTLAFTKDGTGTLTLSGSSTFTGAANIFTGAVNVRSATALGSTAAGTTVWSGATLEVQGGVALAEPLTLGGSGATIGAGALRSVAGSNTLTGGITLASAARVNADAGLLTLGGGITGGGNTLTIGGGGDVAVSGAIGSGAGGLVKDGVGTATLSGGNVYAGLTSVSAGTLRVANGTGLGTTAAGTVVSVGGVLQVQGGITVAGEAVTTPILQSISGTNTWTGSITAQNQSALTLRSDADTLTISGVVDARSADATNQALALTGAGGGTITQAITNPTSVTKSGAGTWVLAGANTYATATAVTGGTLRVGAPNALSPNSALTLANTAGATLALDGYTAAIASLDGGGATGGNVTLGAGSLSMGGNTSFGGQITGSAGSVLSKTGSGGFSQAAGGAITGTVALGVNGGSFYANGTLGAAVTTTVGAGASLGGSGVVSGLVTVAAGGGILAGDAANTGRLTLANLVFGATTGDTGSIRLFNLDLGAAAATFEAANVTANGGAGSVTISATNSGALANGTYNLFGYSGTLNDFSAFKTVPGSISGLSGRQSGTLQNTPGTMNYVQLVVAGDSPKWSGFNALTQSQDLVWAVPGAGGPENWTLVGGNTPTDYQTGDSVLFNDTAGAGNTTVNITQGNVSPTSVTIDNATLGYVFDSTGGFGISGSTGVVKNGAGGATFNAPLAFTGGLKVNAGSVILAAVNSFSGGIDINGGGIVTLAAAGAAGAGNEVAFGPGATGQLRLNGRSATLSGLLTDATSPGSPLVRNGDAATASTLTLDISGPDAFAGVLEDGGAAPLALALQGGGTLVLTGSNTATGGNTLAGAGTTLQVGNGGADGSLAGDTNLASGTVLRFNLTATRTYAGNVAGAGGLVAQGGGTLVLTGNAAHTGGTTIAAGQTLQVGGGGSSGDLSGTGVIANAGTLALNRSGSATIQAQITGSGGLTTSAGTLILTAANAYQGATTIGSGSTLQMGGGGSTGTLGTAATVTTSGTLAVSRSGSLTFGTNVVGSGGFDARMTGGGVLTLTGTNTYAGGTTVSSGTLRLGVAAAFPTLTGLTVGGSGTAGTFDLNNIGVSVSSLATAGTPAGQVITNSGTGTAILTYAGVGTSSFGGVIQDTSGTQRIGITITGGTLRLARTNAYTGGTVVASGTAQLGADNAFATGSLTLGGSGTAGILDLAGFNQSLSTFAVGSGATAASQVIGNSSTTADSVLTYTGGSITWQSTLQDAIGSGTRKTGLALTGTTTFTVVSVNPYSGPTTIGTGTTLRIGAGGTVGSLGATPITNNGTLVFNRTDTYTMAAGNTVTGGGAVTIAAGTVATSANGALNSTGLLTIGSGSTVANLDLTDGGAAVGGLTIATNTAATNTITIGSGRTLTVNGNVVVGNGTGGGQTLVTTAGGGTLAVTGTNFNVGGTIGSTNNASRSTLDLSGLANLTASLSGALTIQPTGDNTGTAASRLILAAASNAITAPSVLVGNSSTGAVQTLRLGAGANVLNTNLVNLGAGNRDTGVINFADTTGTLTLRNLAGTGRVGNVNLGRQATEGTGYTTANVIDLSGHAADAAIGTLAMALGAKTAANTNDFLFDQGTLDILTVNMAVAKGAGTSVNRLVIGGGSVRLGGSAVFGDSGTGTVTLATAGSGELAISGGTMTSTANFVKGTGGTGTAILTLSGGTLDMSGRSIGLASQLIDTVTFSGGTLANVGQLNNGGMLTKTGAGTLTLTGTNTYTGTTAIDAGTLSIAAAQTLAGGVQFGSTDSVATAGTLALAGGNAGFGQFVAQTDSATATSVITIPTGRTLTIGGNVQIGTNRAAATTTLLSASGGGAFVVNNPAAGGLFVVGGTTGATGQGNEAIADLSGLASLSVTLDPASGVFRVNPTMTNSNLTLAGKRSILTLPDAPGAGSTTVTANVLGVGTSGLNAGVGGQLNELRLGRGTSTFNVNTVNIGTGSRDIGSVTFQGATGSIVLRAADGTGPVAFNMGTGVATTANPGLGNVFDLRGHQADLKLAAVEIGTQNRNSSLSNLFGFDAGTLEIGSLVASTKGTNGSTTTTTIEIGGGTVTSGAWTLASNSGPGTASATANLTGGAITFSGAISRGAQTGTGPATGAVNLAGATLDLGGYAIGSAMNPIVLTATSGTLRNLSELNGGGTLAKTGVGILTLAGTNAYTGLTDIQAGEIRVGSAGGLSGSSAFTVGSGAFLSLAGNAATIGGLTGAGTVRNQAASAATLTVGGAGGTFSGLLQDGTGGGGLSLSKIGTGTLILSSPNTFSGGTAVNAGRLVATNAASLGTGNVTIASGGMLELDVSPLLGSSAITISPGGGLVVASGVSVPLGGLSSLGGWQIDPSTLGRLTVARLLAGTVLAGGTTLSAAWAGPAPSNLYSDILELSGTGAGNPYVLSMTYDSAISSDLLTELNISRRNSGSGGAFAPVGTSFQGVGVPWTAAFTTVGQYGVDTATQTVWVVGDTNSEFVVVPEPGVGLLGGIGAVGIAAVLLRRRLAR